MMVEAVAVRSLRFLLNLLFCLSIRRFSAATFRLLASRNANSLAEETSFGLSFTSKNEGTLCLLEVRFHWTRGSLLVFQSGTFPKWDVFYCLTVLHYVHYLLLFSSKIMNSKFVVLSLGVCLTSSLLANLANLLFLE